MNGGGKGIRVSLFIHQLLASGMTGSVLTNDQGDAYIAVDTDRFAQVEVYVDGHPRGDRSTIQETLYV